MACSCGDAAAKDLDEEAEEEMKQRSHGENSANYKTLLIYIMD